MIETWENDMKVIELQTEFTIYWRKLNKIAASYGIPEYTYSEAMAAYRFLKDENSLLGS